MRAARTFANVALTLFLALAAGFIIENGDTTAARIGAGFQSPGMARASVLPEMPTLPRPPIATLQATPLPTTHGWGEPKPTSIDLQPFDRSEFVNVSSTPCAPEMRVSDRPGGWIRIALNSPCNIGEPVNFRHSGITFSEIIPDSGSLVFDIPALSRDAEVEAILQDGRNAKGFIEVPSAEDYHRVAVVWRGNSGLHIHAQEFGAELGTVGHVWVGAPGRPDLGSMAKTGYMTALGDRNVANGTQAEIYTYPVNPNGPEGVVRLSVRTEVRNTNCGSVVAAEVAQPDGFGGVVTSDLTVRVPQCDQIGQHLVLKNVLRDLMIAHN